MTDNETRVFRELLGYARGLLGYVRDHGAVDEEYKYSLRATIESAQRILEKDAHGYYRAPAEKPQHDK